MLVRGVYCAVRIEWIELRHQSPHRAKRGPQYFSSTSSDAQNYLGCFPQSHTSGDGFAVLTGSRIESSAAYLGGNV
jgi:hypothetical protein